MRTLYSKIDHPAEDIKETENNFRALLNILEDFHGNEKKLEQTNLAILNILEDIEKERSKLEETMHSLEAANKELEAFAYSVSHDLQAPLRAISGFSQIILEDHSSQLNDEIRRYLKLIQDNSHLMGRLIQDLLAFSRLGRQRIIKSKICMEKLVQEVFDGLISQVSDRKIDFQLTSLPDAVGDPSMIRQVFVNLLSNALKFTKYRELARIEVGYRLEKDEIIYYVKDNGAGFDRKYVDQLFKVFQRLHTTQEFEGTGIGLALVKRIIVRHHGRIWAEGNTNQGACFSFTIGE